MRTDVLKRIVTWTLVFLTGLVSAEAIAQVSTAPSGAITYLQNDLTGNVVLATNASGGTVWEERYLPYGGKQLGAAGGTGGVDSSSQKYGYHEKALDPQTGLQYFGARYYDPLSGRFSGMDPRGPTEANIYTFNRYAFANGNPYRYTDPDGKVVVDIIFVAYDIYTLATEGATTVNLIATGLDVASTFGFGFGAGTIFRAARVAEHAAEGARAIEAGVHTVEGTSTIAANRVAGLAAEAKAEKELVEEGNTILGSHVSVRTSEGRRVVDHLIKTPDGRIVAVEVKSGGAVRNASQLAKDEAMATKGGVVIGKNAPNGLRGQEIVIETIERRY